MREERGPQGLHCRQSDGPCILCSHSFPYVHECCILAAFLAYLELGLLCIPVNEHTDQNHTKPKTKPIKYCASLSLCCQGQVQLVHSDVQGGFLSRTCRSSSPTTCFLLVLVSARVEVIFFPSSWCGAVFWV